MTKKSLHDALLSLWPVAGIAEKNAHLGEP